MTKYVLNSGGLSRNPDGARRFFAELVSGFGTTPKILICFFAQPREMWEPKYEQYKITYGGLMPVGVSPEYKLAYPDSFKEQVAWADIIYCHGGDDYLARYWFERLDVPSVWQEKVIGTNSATTHILSKSFWTCDWRQPLDGMGIVPIRTIAHFESDYGINDPRGPIDWQKAKAELEAHSDATYPIQALHEGEFIVIEDL